jgi:hypothetical protein
LILLFQKLSGGIVFKFRDEFGLKILPFMAMFLVGLAVLMGTIAVASYQTNKFQCGQFEKETNWDTRWVVYVSIVVPISYDCVARTKTGKWISIDRLREIDG